MCTHHIKDVGANGQVAVGGARLDQPNPAELQGGDGGREEVEVYDLIGIQHHHKLRICTDQSVSLIICAYDFSYSFLSFQKP